MVKTQCFKTYTFSPTTVFRDYSRRRGIALEGLKAVAGRFDERRLQCRSYWTWNGGASQLLPAS